MWPSGTAHNWRAISGIPSVCPPPPINPFGSLSRGGTNSGTWGSYVSLGLPRSPSPRVEKHIFALEIALINTVFQNFRACGALRCYYVIFLQIWASHRFQISLSRGGQTEGIPLIGDDLDSFQRFLTSLDARTRPCSFFFVKISKSWYWLPITPWCVAYVISR